MLSQVERHVRVTVLEIMNNEWYTGCETPKLSQIIYELNYIAINISHLMANILVIGLLIHSYFVSVLCSN